MAFYCSHEVRFRGRLLEVDCRYCSVLGITILKGDPLPELENYDFYYAHPTKGGESVPLEKRRKVIRVLLRVMRRKGIFNASGHCDCGRYC